jgi:hypothetical protein
MSRFYLYADEASHRLLSGSEQKIIAIGSDFGYGNFGDVLQHINALKAVKKGGRFSTVSVMAANAISHEGFPAWVPSAYSTDAVVFVAEYPLILSDDDPKLHLVGEIRNVAGVHLYGGGFLNRMWGDYVLSVVEFFLKQDAEIPYLVSGQQITSPYQQRVLEHIKAFEPRLFGVRDEPSRQLLQDVGFDADYSFDDATEALSNLTRTVGLQRGKGVFMHLNSSDYTANQSLRVGIGRELAMLAGCPAARNGLTVFQAFRDTRQDVFDSTETIKRLDCFFPFHEVKLIDLVGLLFDRSDASSSRTFLGELGYSCSYHVALWLQLSGVPCWLRSSNPFYDQKSRALQVTQDLEEFIKEPKLADHRLNLERREAWSEILQSELNTLRDSENVCKFASDAPGPAPWRFFYKGKPTLREQLNESEKSVSWQRNRADVAERDLGIARGENGELHGRVEALTAQLTEVGDEANRQRERADVAERDLGIAGGEIGELHGRVEALSEQLNTILASRSWRLTRGLRVMGRLLRGQFTPVLQALRSAKRND